MTFSTRLTKLKFSPQTENFCMISPIDVCLVSKCESAQRVVLKNRMINGEEEAML